MKQATSVTNFLKTNYGNTILNSTTTAATSETRSSYPLPLFFLAIFALPMINKNQVEERL